MVLANPSATASSVLVPFALQRKSKNYLLAFYLLACYLLAYYLLAC